MTIKITGRGVLIFFGILLALLVLSSVLANVGEGRPRSHGTATRVTRQPTTSRTIFLRNQDIAVFGGVQCIANVEAGVRHMLCSKRPRSRALYDVAIFPRHVTVYRMGNPDNPLFTSKP